MSKKIQLHIPTPCHENWDKMMPVEKARPDDSIGRGKFCGSCQKQVVDFTRMSDREVAMFFKKSSTGSVCGRFMQDQLDRDIMIPKKRIPWLKYFFQFALPAFLVSAKATAQGNVKKEMVEEKCAPSKVEISKFTKKDFVGVTTILPEVKVVTSNHIMRTMGLIMPEVEEFVVPKILTGRVIDESGEGIPFATIMVKETTIGIKADVNGFYSIKLQSKMKDIVLIGSASGMETTEILLTEKNFSEEQTIILRAMVSGELIVTVGLVIPKTPVITKTPEPKMYSGRMLKDNNLNFFKLYPNPIKSGATLNIEWRKNDVGNYKLELFNLAGQLIFSKEIWIDEEARLLNIQIPQVAAGNYFLRMTGKTSRKSYTEKIIIQ